MYIQLAEAPRRRKGHVSVSGYNRRARVKSHQRRFPLNENGDIDNPYIYVPNFSDPNGPGLYVRENKFDSMPDDQWARFLQQVSPYQPEVQNCSMSEDMFLASRADRKARREQRKKNKTDRNARKNDRSASKAELRRSKGEAKKNKSERGGFDWESALDKGKDLYGKFTGKGGGDDDGGSDSASAATTGGGAWYTKTPVILGGAAGLGLLAWALTRKK